MSASIGVEGRNANEPVDSAFGFDVAIGIGTFDTKSGLADTSPFTFGYVFNFYFKTTAFSPACIHAEKHIRPIVGLRATRSRFNGDDGVGFVVRSREE